MLILETVVLIQFHDLDSWNNFLDKYKNPKDTIKIALVDPSTNTNMDNPHVVTSIK